MPRSVLCMGLMGLIAAGCGPSVNLEQERSALMAQDRAWSESTKDSQKFNSYFASDASMYPPGMPIARGSDAIRKAAGEMFAMPGFSIQWSATKAAVGSGGDLGYTSGTYTMSVNDPTGKPMTENGKYVTVWKKVDGQWKVVEDIFNGDTPPPAPAAAPSPSN